MPDKHRKNTISVAVITLNEEDRLAACLKSAAFADDLVVVDSGSTDGTFEIAKQFGARIFKKDWCGFGLQKQFAIEQCLGQWILILDADERIPPETASEITKITQAPNRAAAYAIARKNYFMGRWIKHAGWWPDRTVRLFKKGKAYMPPQLVHESLVVAGETGELANPLIHYPFRDLSHMMKKMDCYSSSGAAEMFQNGQRSSYPKALMRAAWAFFYNYFIRRGMLDGGPGLVISVSDAVNKFFKYTKLKEMGESEAGNP